MGFLSKIKVISLGSGQVLPWETVPKAALLHQLALFNFPIPKGVILLVDEGNLELLANREQLEVLQTDLIVRGLGRFVAIRAAIAPKDPTLSRQSVAPLLNVDLHQTDSLLQAFQQLYFSLPDTSNVLRWDVLIQDMVPGRIVGRVFSQSGYQDDLLQFCIGTQLRKSKQIHTLEIERLETGEQRVLLDFRGRLQRVLRHLRTALGTDGWRIGWIDNGESVTLIQVEPLEPEFRRGEWFSRLHYRDILPELPSVLNSSLLDSLAPRLFPYYSKVDPELPPSRELIKTVEGRPVVNLSLLRDILRHYGVATRILPKSIGGKLNENHGWNLLRIWKRLPAAIWFWKSQLLLIQQARKKGKEFRDTGVESSQDLEKLLEAAKDLMTNYTQAVFALLGTLLYPITLFRMLGVLTPHHRDSFSDGLRFFSTLENLREKWALSPLSRPANISDLDLNPEWNEIKKEYGHWAFFPTELACPRFHEDPSALFRFLTLPPQMIHKPQRKYSLLTLISRPLWHWVVLISKVHESLREDLFISFDHIRSQLLSKADTWVAEGKLPSREKIWDLTDKELIQLSKGEGFTADFWGSREALIADRRIKNIPVTFISDDLHPEFESQPLEFPLTGNTLVSGDVDGVAWVMDSPSFELPKNCSPTNTILVTGAVNESWGPILSQVKGVIIETGGDLSHGSRLIREMGVPSIIGVEGALSKIRTGDRLRLTRKQVDRVW